MITRGMAPKIREALGRQAAVALLGPRRVGKTTLAREIARENDAHYLDLQKPADRARLADPVGYLNRHQDRLVVLDEIHQVPDLFPVLRGLIDAGRRLGHRTGRFLILGSASTELLRQGGALLAGWISPLELGPLNLAEIGADPAESLWVRGGFPESFLAADDRSSLAWREDFIRTYLERDIPQFGPRIAAGTLRRFWTMQAHAQGGLHNAARLAAGLEVSGQSVARYTDLLVDMFLVRRLPPYPAQVGKRLVKSPKVYLRDSGLVHALLHLSSREELLGHPVVGGSWEGWVLENLLAAVPERTVPGFYRTFGGAEIDLVLEFPGGPRWAIEIKRSPDARPSRGFHEGCRDLGPDRRWLVHSGTGRHPLPGGVEAIGLLELLVELALPASRSQLHAPA
ncbi:MAG: ATP-binding protein [Verrucomicrobiota bacterium]